MALKSLKQLDKLLEEENYDEILKQQVRRVKWLYNNSNKNTLVYEEKLVRLIVHRLKQRIRELEAEPPLVLKKQTKLK